MIGNRRGHPLPAPCVSSALASGTWLGGPWRWGLFDREPGNAKWREWHSERHSERPAQVRRCRSHRCRRPFCTAAPGKLVAIPKRRDKMHTVAKTKGRQGPDSRPPELRVAQPPVARAEWWRCTGASASTPSHVIVPPVALGQAWDSSLVAPRQKQKQDAASQTSASSAHRHSMILAAYFG